MDHLHGIAAMIGIDEAVAPAELRRRLAFGGSDPALDSCVVLSGPDVVAFAHLWLDTAAVRAFVRVRKVRPAGRATGVIMRWLTDRAFEMGQGRRLELLRTPATGIAASTLVSHAFRRDHERILMVRGRSADRRAVLPDGLSGRHIDLSDLPQAHSCYREAFEGSFEYQEFDDPETWWAARGDIDIDLCYVVARDDRVLGYCLAGPGRVAELAVLPEARRNGIGSWLLQTATTAAAGEDEGEVRLSVDATNSSGALPLYRRGGFRTVQRHAVWFKTFGTTGGHDRVAVP